MVDRRVDDVMRLSNRPRPKRARQEGGGPIVNELLENRVRGAPRERRSAIFRLIGCKKETLYRSNGGSGDVTERRGSNGKFEGGPGALTPARCRC